MFRKTLNPLLLIGTACIYATTTAWAMGQIEPGATPPPAASQSSCDNCAQALRGNVVYERPDGIYWHPLGAERSRLLHRDGSWPRWSPDGRSVGFIFGRKILLKQLDDGLTREIATADKPRALAFFADGHRLAYTDGDRIKSVDIASGETTTLLEGKLFLEIDLAEDDRFLAATIKRLGYSVWLFDLSDASAQKIANGCSASLSPDGRLITNLVDGHRRLVLRETKNGVETGKISAPPDLKFDNQNWSNHLDWLVSISEGDTMRVYAHHVPTDQAFAIGVDSDSDRPDLYIEPTAH